jgi:hypothetical protein
MPPPSAIVDDPAEVATERYARRGLGNAQTYNKNKLRFRALLIEGASEVRFERVPGS